MVRKISAGEFRGSVLESPIPVVVDFSATWCGPCKKLAPIVAELAQELAGKVDFYEVDTGVDPNLAQENAVMSLPTLLFFKSGKVQDRIVGLVSKDKIMAKISTLI